MIYLCITCLQKKFCLLYLAINFGNCTHMFNAHEVLHWQSQMFHNCKLYLFLQIYDPLDIPV